MFWPQNEKLLIKDIINLLDKQSGYLSMKEITEQLNYSTIHKVQLTCHFLKEQIAALYPPEDLELIINMRDGVCLKRENTNLNLLMENINNELITFQAVLEVLEKREFITLDYCEEHFISKSTLARYIQKANAAINYYGSKNVRITLSEVVKILGDESCLRLIYYFLLKSTYENLEEFEDWQECLQLTEKILNYLQVSFIQTQLEHVAIWTYVCQSAVKNHFIIKENDSFLTDKTNYQFAAQPDFLNEWSEDDWQLFFLFLYSTEYISIKDAVLLINHHLYENIVTTWFSAFEETYFSVSEKQKNKLTLIKKKQLQYLKMTEIQGTLADLVETPSNSSFLDSLPIYQQTFEKFWQTFRSKMPRKKFDLAFQMASFQNCITLTNLDYFKPQVLLYVINETTESLRFLSQEIIKMNCKKFNIVFVDDYRKADIIVSSISFIDPISENQELVIVRGSLQPSDINSIKDSVKKIHFRKSAIYAKLVSKK